MIFIRVIAHHVYVIRVCGAVNCAKKLDETLNTTTWSPNEVLSSGNKRLVFQIGRGILVRLYFCAFHFCPKRKMFTFSQAHSDASTNATRHHEYFRGLSRLLPVPGVLMSFLELHFLSRGLFERLRAPSQSQKGHFSEKMKLKK